MISVLCNKSFLETYCRFFSSNHFLARFGSVV
nr:MAG TPA: hypothetical protein [Caudoviricetes sp.]